MLNDNDKKLATGFNEVSISNQSVELVEKRLATLDAIAKTIYKSLEQGVDYVMIQDKPFPQKSALAKIVLLLGLKVSVIVVNKIEQFDEGFFHYEKKVVLSDSQLGEIAEGTASCNTKESN